MFEVTEGWLRANCNYGAPSREQIECLGQSYPPPPGWMRLLTGLRITESQREKFESLRKRQTADLFGSK